MNSSSKNGSRTKRRISRGTKNSAAIPTTARFTYGVVVKRSRKLWIVFSLRSDCAYNFAEKIESARAVCFLLDEQGKMVAQSTKWVIGGTKERPALAAGATNSFHFVVASDKPFASTNLIARVQFNRLVLKGGKLADVSKSVHVENKSGVR